MHRGRQAALVGRDDELARIDEFLSRTVAGADALIVEGEAGIGKTTLWSAGVTRAREAGIRVLFARPAEAERELSFAALGDLLADVHQQIRKLPAPQRRSLARALLLEETRGAPVEPRAVAVALLTMLQLLAADQPLLVAVDDVQWVDASSALALSFALRRAFDERVRVLFALRTGQGNESGIQLDPRVSVERVVTGPLSLGALRQLLQDRLGATFPRPILRRICDTAGGNPFFALELSRALEAKGQHLAPHEELPVPSDLSRLLERRLAALPSELTEPLAAVAAVAEPTLDLVGQDVIEPALEAGVLVLDRDRLRFEHPLVATAAYARLTLARRRALHSRLADIVQGSEERVRHLARAFDPPDSEIAAALEQAAEDAFKRGAIESAAELLEHALRFTPAADEALHRRRLAAAGYQARAGDKDRAREILAEARSVVRAGRERAEIALTATWFGLFDPAACIDALRHAVDDARDDALLTVRVQSALAPMLLYLPDVSGALRHAEIALERAQEVGDDAHLVLGLVCVMHTRFFAGLGVDVEQAERAVALEAVAGNTYGNVGLAAGFLGDALATVGDIAGARKIFARKAAEERRRGDIGIAWTLSELARVEISAGNWQCAVDLAEEALEVARDAGDIQQQALAYRRLVAVAVLRGDEERARTLATEALRLADVGQTPLSRAEVRSYLGLLDLSLGDPDAAAMQFQEVARFVADAGFGDPDILPFVPDQVEALVAIGDVEAAERATATLEGQARRLSRPITLARGRRCRGIVAAAKGELGGAVAALTEASAMATEIGQPFELARTLLAEGETLRRFKKKRAAREAIEGAVRIFDELGANVWSAKGRRELARVSGRARTNGLTETERRVAALVAAGRSNKQIASELFVSVRTVETHLTKVYAKLAVHSRTELVSRLPT